MVDARFRDLSRETLCDLDRLGDTSSLRDQARYIGARGEEAAFFQRFHMDPNRCFVHGASLMRGRRVA